MDGVTDNRGPLAIMVITDTCSGVTAPGFAEIETVPLNAPAVVGVAVMEMVHEAPAARGPLHPVAVTPSLVVMVTAP